jgi:hypothetical protein
VDTVLVDTGLVDITESAMDTDMDIQGSVLATEDLVDIQDSD